MTPHYALDVRTATAHFPGIGRYAANLARALAPQLAPAERLTLLANQPPAWSVEGQAEWSILRGGPFSLSQQWTAPRALHRLGAALYHSPYYLMPYWPGVRSVVTIHDLIPMRYPRYYGASERLAFGVASRMATRRATRIVTDSRATARDVERLLHVAPARVSVIPLAADPAFTPRPASEIEDARRRYGLAGDYALYLGSNKPHKNLLGLIEAWACLQPQPMPLVVAGAWDARYPEARARAEALGLGERVRWLGPALEPDLPLLYSGAAAFVFPSLYEGFGLPVLEAMACGAPVACSDAASLPEVAGDAALTFDPADVQALAHTLHRLLTDRDLRADLRERGLRRAAQFSWAATAGQTLALYRDLAGRP